MLENIPKWYKEKLCYLTIAGSRSYFCQNDKSDYDLYGFYMPTKRHIKTILEDNNPEDINNKIQKNYIKRKKNFEFKIFNFLDFIDSIAFGYRRFSPFLLETLFSDRQFLVFQNHVGEIVYENRLIFINQTTVNYFIRMANIQFEEALENEVEYSRLKQFGHAFRLLNEVESIIEHRVFNTTTKNDFILTVRNNEISLKEIKNIFYSNLKKINEYKKCLLGINIMDLNSLKEKCILLEE